jgi:hypothetical protein
MNWDKIEQLLNIVDRSITHGTKLQGITNAALAELAKHEAEAKPKPEIKPTFKAGEIKPELKREPESEAEPVRRREVPEEVNHGA